MASKILAGLLAVAVLSVGGYTYWQYADGHGCCGTRTVAPADDLSVGCPSHEAISPCCQEPSRSSGLSTADDSPTCCEDAPAAAPTPEVLAIRPREVK